ncbi:MAG: hypothetical protein Tsb005_01200 [Gammaproteobacteria bacterium]
MKWFLRILLLWGTIGLASSGYALAWSQGIYISQSTLERTDYLKYLIRRSKEVGINTFVIDFNHMTKKYRENIALVKRNGLHYVVRIVVFPDGGKPWQVESPKYWERKYKLVEQAISVGAEQVQLDYIRYHVGQRPSAENAQDIHRVIKWFKERLKPQGIPLQIAVFGIASFGPSYSIGQNLLLFADSVDVVCPMVYPSHYEPYQKHAHQPYQTILTSLLALHNQFKQPLPFKLKPYIELTNYRYKNPPAGKYGYIIEQLRAVQDSNSDGWYAWSANNLYDRLFYALKHAPKSQRQILSETFYDVVKPITIS